MVCTSCAADKANPADNPRWRRILWLALGINAAMFAVEMIAGLVGGSKALQADALDFLGDAANYAISLGVAGLALTWRARAALVKGATLILFGAYVLASALWALRGGGVPEAPLMGAVGVAALIANAGVAAMLYRYRAGDANMRSVWICSRNDAIGNVAVLAAAAGVFGTAAAWPDLIVAAIMAGLALWGGSQIVGQALGELRQSSPNRKSPRVQAALLVTAEMRAFDQARVEGRSHDAWRALERAHILSQRYLAPHLANHWAMLGFAIVQRDGREVAGQIVRLALAPLGALTDRIPIGNTGRARVSAFTPMPIPDDLRVISSQMESSGDSEITTKQEARVPALMQSKSEAL